MSILPSFLSSQIQNVQAETKSVIEIPREYEIDFQTGQMTGRIVEGIEAIRVWIWMCLHTERYRYPIYPWNYGVELEQYIGSRVSEEYLQTDCRSEIEAALKVNPWIQGIDEFKVEMHKDKLSLSFIVRTILGEVSIDA